MKWLLLAEEQNMFNVDGRNRKVSAAPLKTLIILQTPLILQVAYFYRASNATTQSAFPTDSGFKQIPEQACFK